VARIEQLRRQRKQPARHIHRLVTDNGACYRAHDFATGLHASVATVMTAHR
jgi:hypothetical protein